MDTQNIVIRGFDYVEFYVGNAKQAAYYYQTAFGFQPLAYRGLETGHKAFSSYVLQQGKVRIVLTTDLGRAPHIADHVKTHGDGVKVVAFTVDNARLAYEQAVARGAKPFMQPTEESDEHGTITKSGIYTFGETVHIFVQRQNYQGAFLPGYSPYTTKYTTADVGLVTIDHIVGNTDWDQMERWVRYYEQTLDFHQYKSFDDKDIRTDYTALRSKVMANATRSIKMPINEPAEGLKKSQIEEYIDFYGSAGVQHIALATHDIVATMRQLHQRGVEFLFVPDSYYDTVTERVGEIDEDLDELKRLGILVDSDESGYLLQIFTKPVQDRPTLFFEIIQRKGAQSFGKGNFKALFESIELEQERRGTL